jgi:hypothetical protein
VGRDSEVDAWDAHGARRQTIRNERPIPPRSSQVALDRPVAVVAWIVWENDGLELVDTEASAWAGRDVLVRLLDQRRRGLGVWLAAQDVRRKAW